jgi:hypothetical protein
MRPGPQVDSRRTTATFSFIVSHFVWGTDSHPELCARRTDEGDGFPWSFLLL